MNNQRFRPRRLFTIPHRAHVTFTDTPENTPHESPHRSGLKWNVIIKRVLPSFFPSFFQFRYTCTASQICGYHSPESFLHKIQSYSLLRFPILQTRLQTVSNLPGRVAPMLPLLSGHRRYEDVSFPRASREPLPRQREMGPQQARIHQEGNRDNCPFCVLRKIWRYFATVDRWVNLMNSNNLPAAW